MIKLKTKLPGPKNRAMMAERKKHVPRGVSHWLPPVFVAKAHGAVIEDVDGNHLMDFTCGFAVVNLGHTPEPVVRAIQDQAARFLHQGFFVAPYEPYLQLAERLCNATPGTFPKKAMFATSGAEAVENAVKICRAATGRPAIVCFSHAYHGRTYMAMTMTDKAKPFKRGFAPFCPEVYRAPFPYPYRWPGGGEEGADPDLVTEECFRHFEDLVMTSITPEKVAGVIIEPVLGEGGYVPAPPKFMQKLQAFCRKHGIVFAADEIQSGFGRTGTLFACEQQGVEPDMMILSKGLANGMPISAVVGRAEIMDAPSDDTLGGGTYGGNPVSCASALAVLDMFEDGSLLKQARKLGKAIEKKLRAFKDKYSFIGNVRGLGAMWGIEFVTNRATKAPDADACEKMITGCYKRGLIILPAGTLDNLVRLVPPITVEPKQFEQGFEVAETVLQSIQKSR
jgi:4-aminobutyrate aminotransferase/(S)-3-amino-2-methylpropionate transaminase